MNIPENSYGFQKRLRYISYHLKQKHPQNVLDFGCGTGVDLTMPLAEMFPLISFIGIDNDPNSIRYANQNNTLPNLTFLENGQLPDNSIFDTIICSEVIEHLDDPDRTLFYLSNKLSPEGILILTLPNGYGPFEFVSFVQNLLQISKIIPLLRWIKRKIFSSQKNQGPKDTLANSPHINFFTYAQIKQLILATGFFIKDQRPRTFLCGFGFDQLLFFNIGIDFNQKIADQLPLWMDSGWMFILGKASFPNSNYRFKRNWFAKFRGFINKHS